MIAADNLFEFSLAAYVDFWRGKGEGSASRSTGSPTRRSPGSTASSSSTTTTASCGIEEKPEQPRSDLVSTATYLFSRDHVALLERYLADGHPPDPPGRFLVWLHEREPVYGYRFSEDWLDIGDPRQLLEADNRYRARAGLPLRDEYALESARRSQARREPPGRLTHRTRRGISTYASGTWFSRRARGPPVVRSGVESAACCCLSPRASEDELAQI